MSATSNNVWETFHGEQRESIGNDSITLQTCNNRSGTNTTHDTHVCQVFFLTGNSSMGISASKFLINLDESQHISIAASSYINFGKLFLRNLWIQTLWKVVHILFFLSFLLQPFNAIFSPFNISGYGRLMAGGDWWGFILLPFIPNGDKWEWLGINGD